MILPNYTLFLKKIIKDILLLLFMSYPLFCFSQYKLKDTTQFIEDNLSDYMNKLDQYKFKNIPTISREATVRILMREYYIDELVSGNDTLNKDHYYALNHHLSQKSLNSLTSRDLFNSCMIVQEYYSQTCGRFARLKSTGIFGIFYRDDIPLEYWSPRQINLLRKNRKEIIGYVNQMWSDLKFIGDNTKDLLVELIMWEQIPNILKQIEISPEDNSLYSLLVQIMMRAKFTTFEASTIYEKIYGPKRYVTGTEENRTAIIEMAKKCFMEFNALPQYTVPIYVKQSNPSYSSEGLKEELITRKQDWPLKEVKTPKFKLKK